MRDKQRICTIPEVFLFLIVLAVFSTGSLYADQDSKYLDAVRTFADRVLQSGTDIYGPNTTPLFADGLNVKTLEPVKWKCRGQTWVLSNFASQQPLLRTLDGLTSLTGQKKYRQAAEQATGYALQNLTTPNGLLYWGGHLAWDLEKEQPVGQYADVHELKSHQPYYRIMWRVNASATRKLMESVWMGHILDWSRLDYNRHASVKKPIARNWNHQFKANIEVPFPIQSNNLSFVNVTPPLLHCSATLAILDKNTDVLNWTRRLAYRWQQGKDPKTGLCGGQLSYRKHDRAQDALGHVHPNINEAKIVASYHQTSRYHNLPLAQMQAASALMEVGGKYAMIGHEFIFWASEDLKAYTKHSYDAKAGQFIALMTDGTPIRWQESRSGYYVPASFVPRKPDGFILWGYAMAFRLTSDEIHWQMARNILRQFNLGDIGRPDGIISAIKYNNDHNDWRTIYALLELHQATNDTKFLRLACSIADNLLKMQTRTGLFPRSGRQWARTGDEIPLALLHLAAAIKGKGSLLPPPIFDGRFFHCEYHGQLDEHQQKRDDKRTYDHMVFYGGS
jgi:pectate lyase